MFYSCLYYQPLPSCVLQPSSLCKISTTLPHLLQERVFRQPRNLAPDSLLGIGKPALERVNVPRLLNNYIVDNPIDVLLDASLPVRIDVHFVEILEPLLDAAGRDPAQCGVSDRQVARRIGSDLRRVDAVLLAEHGALGLEPVLGVGARAGHAGLPDDAFAGGVGDAEGRGERAAALDGVGETLHLEERRVVRGEVRRVEGEFGLARAEDRVDACASRFDVAVV